MTKDQVMTVQDWADLIANRTIEDLRERIGKVADQGHWTASKTQLVIEATHKALVDRLQAKE